MVLAAARSRSPSEWIQSSRRGLRTRAWAASASGQTAGALRPPGPRPPCVGASAAELNLIVIGPEAGGSGGDARSHFSACYRCCTWMLLFLLLFSSGDRECFVRSPDTPIESGIRRGPSVGRYFVSKIYLSPANQVCPTHRRQNIAKARSGLCWEHEICCRCDESRMNLSRPDNGPPGDVEGFLYLCSF